MREKLLSSRKRILDNVTSMQKEEQARLEAIRREKEARLEAIRLEEKKKEEMKNAWQTQQQGNWSVRSSSRRGGYGIMVVDRGYCYFSQLRV